MDRAIYILNRIAASVIERAEVMVTVVVIGVVFMMVLPLPTALVDTLIALNISVSLMLVVMALYMPGPLAFSTFPGLLLVTTLFRVALSVTTTRLILLNGEAGSIVETFGNFVVGGNLVVGLVIFLILTVVQFLVITKGSERVAEVAARFTLDAMPGKQMSIDSDLRADLISPEEAKNKRAKVTKESQLFGAMDGAMKFVKGDAIAGIVIVLVNLIGGFSIGILQLGLPAGEAIKVYGVLTIGDGLVAQIPALLISLTAGMIITRVEADSQREVNVGREIAEQLSSQPKAWIISGCVMFGFAMIPGMPSIAFIVLGMIVTGSGWFQVWSKNRKVQQIADLEEGMDSKEAAKEGDIDLNMFEPYQKITLVTHPSLAEQPIMPLLVKQSKVARNQIVMDYGYTIPPILVYQDERLAENEYQLRVYDVPVFSGIVREDAVALQLDDKSRETIKNLDIAVQEGAVEYGEKGIVWCSRESAIQLEEHGVSYSLFLQFVRDSLSRVLFENCPQFIGLEETNRLLKWLSEDQPELVKELQQVLPIARFSEMLQLLAIERISLRGVQRIVESIVEHAPQERDIGELTELVRVSLKEQICGRLSVNNMLYVCMLEPETEELLRSSVRKTMNGGFMAVSPEQSQSLMDKISAIISSLPVDNRKSMALLVAHDIRRFMRDVIKGDLPHIPVLSYAELTPLVSVKPLGRVAIDQAVE